MTVCSIRLRNGQWPPGAARPASTWEGHPKEQFQPRKCSQQFLPLNGCVRWADVRIIPPCRPNGHPCSMAKTADVTFSVPTVAHGYGLEIPHPHPCRMTCMTCPLDQVTVGCLTVLLLLNSIRVGEGSLKIQILPCDPQNICNRT